MGSDDNELTFSNMSLIGDGTILNVTNGNSQITLDNVDLAADISGTEEYELTLNTQADSATTITGTVTNANAALSTGTLVFAQNSLANSSLNVTGGTVDLNDTSTIAYTIGKFTGTNNGKFKIDVNGLNSDTFTLGEGSSGVLYIDSINFMGSIPSSEFRIKVLMQQIVQSSWR